MFLPSRTIAVAVVLLLLLSRVASGFSDEATIAWLERAGLDGLVLLKLQDQLEQAAGDERLEIAMRLATLYAAALGETDDPEARESLQLRAQLLLEEVPLEHADQLRIELERGRFLAMETACESYRIRLGEPVQPEELLDGLDHVTAALSTLRTRLRAKESSLQRRLSASQGGRAARLRQEHAQVQDQQRMATFLLAWSRYYEAWLTNRTSAGDEAETLFAQLLTFGQASTVRLDRLSPDMLQDEAMARTVLGMALTKAVTHSTSSALAWLAFLDDGQTTQAIRDEVPGWRLAILLEHGEWAKVRALLQSHASPPVTWLRMVAARGLEAGDGDRRAAIAAHAAVAMLAASGEVVHIYDLVARYGVDGMGDGIIPAYAHAVLIYHDARERFPWSVPEDDPEGRAAFAEAEAALRAAAGAVDGVEHPQVMAAVLNLLGWSEFLQDEMEAAYDAFYRSSGMFTGTKAAEALWMSIVAMDEVATTEGGETQKRLQAIIEEFLERFPHDARAGELILRNAIASDERTLDQVERLLEVTSDSAAWRSAQAAAAQVLYELFQEASGSLRTDLASRYLPIALRLASADLHHALGDPLAPPSVATRSISRSRRILEIALDSDVMRLVAALEALQIIDRAVAASGVTIDHLAGELMYRRIQALLLDGRDSEASDLAADAPAGPHLVVAHRRLYQRGVQSMQGADDRLGIALVQRHGMWLLEEGGGIPAALDDPQLKSVATVVAMGMHMACLRSGDPTTCHDAAELLDEVLAVMPRDRNLLQATARVATARGDALTALRVWRILQVGSDVESSAWFEARVGVLESLLHLDPDQARAVLSQHRILIPDLGPSPWKARIEAVAILLLEAARSSGEEQ